MNLQKIPWRLLRLLAAGAVLAVFAVLYLWPEALPFPVRRAALSSQFTTWTAVAVGKLMVAAVALAATFLFGRVFCSVLCPAGFVQELSHRLGGLLGLRRLSAVAGGNRIILPFMVGAATLAGFAVVANFLDPLGLFGRTGMAAGRGLSFSGGTVVLALTLLGAILLLIVPLFRGRWFCDRACPVGAILGLAAAAGQRGIALDSNKCTGCGRCETICPTRAINSREKRLDAARCILCLDCPAVCPAEALAYRRAVRAERTAAEIQPAAEPVVAGERRGFLRSAAATGAAGLYILSRPLAQWFAPAATAAEAEERLDVLPPGAGGAERHHAGCISCQACVAACPVGIVRMRDGSGLRPVLDFTKGYCQYNCVACAEVCPAGVLRPLPLAEKQRTRMGRTTLELDRCVAVTLNQACGACAEVCPTHAVRMVAAGEGRATVPDFDPRYCVGCGACYHVCPVEPRAFTITGLAEQERTEGVRPGGHGGASDGDERPGQPAGGEGVGEFPF